MAAPTYAAMLESAKQAYSDILSEKIISYQINGRSVTRQNIAVLRSEIQWLETKVAQEAGTRRPAVVAFRNPLA